jgi:hypothetical protein
MIPSNLISVKYTQGNEFLRADTYASYQGYYYELGGKTYIGKEYNLNSVELLKAGSKQVNTLIANPSTTVYGAISGQNIQSVNIVSIQFVATQEDINRGYAMRYFVKKANESLIKETNQSTYNQIKNNPLYQSLELKYDLRSGAEDINVYEKQIPGISNFLLGQETIISEKGPRFEYYNTVQNNLPPQSTSTFDPANDKGRKAEAPNMSSIPDSYLMIVKGPFYANLVPPITGKPEVVDALSVFKKPENEGWAFVGLPAAKPLLLMMMFAKQDGLDLRVTSGFRPALSPPDRVYANLSAKDITDVQRKIYGIPQGQGITANAPSQEYLFKGWITKGKAGGFNLAEDPRGKRGGSNHSRSRAFDLNVGTKNPANTARSLDPKIYQWLIDYAWIFGFIRAVPKEEWHWEYRPEKYQFSMCSKVPNGLKEPWWDNMRLDPTPVTEKRTAEIKAALASGNIPGLPSASDILQEKLLSTPVIRSIAETLGIRTRG